MGLDNDGQLRRMGEDIKDGRRVYYLHCKEQGISKSQR